MVCRQSYIIIKLLGLVSADFKPLEKIVYSRWGSALQCSEAGILPPRLKPKYR